MKGQGNKTVRFNEAVQSAESKGIKTTMTQQLNKAFRSARLALFDALKKGGFQSMEELLKELKKCKDFFYDTIGKEPKLHQEAAKDFLREIKNILKAHFEANKPQEAGPVLLDPTEARFNRLRENMSSQWELTEAFTKAIKNNYTIFEKTLAEINERFALLPFEQRNIVITWMGDRLRSAVDYHTSHPRVILKEIWAELNKYTKGNDENFDKLMQALHAVLFQHKSDKGIPDASVQRLNQISLLEDIEAYEKEYLATMQSLIHEDLKSLRRTHIAVATGISAETLKNLYKTDADLLDHLFSQLASVKEIVKAIKASSDYKRLENKDALKNLPNVLISMLTRDMVILKDKVDSRSEMTQKINYFNQLLSHQENAQILADKFEQGLFKIEALKEDMREVILKHVQSVLVLTEKNQCSLDTLLSELQSLPADVIATVLSNHAFIESVKNNLPEDNIELLTRLKTFHPNVIRCFFADDSNGYNVGIKRSLQILSPQKPQQQTQQPQAAQPEQEQQTEQAQKQAGQTPSPPLSDLACLNWLDNIRQKSPQIFQYIDKDWQQTFNQWDKQWANGLVVALNANAAKRLPTRVLLANMRKLHEGCHLENVRKGVAELFHRIEGLSVYHLVSLQPNVLDQLIRSASYYRAHQHKNDQQLTTSGILYNDIEKFLKASVENLPSEIKDSLGKKPKFSLEDLISRARADTADTSSTTVSNASASTSSPTTGSDAPTSTSTIASTVPSRPNASDGSSNRLSTPHTSTNDISNVPLQASHKFKHLVTKLQQAGEKFRKDVHGSQPKKDATPVRAQQKGLDSNQSTAESSTILPPIINMRKGQGPAQQKGNVEQRASSQRRGSTHSTDTLGRVRRETSFDNKDDVRKKRSDSRTLKHYLKPGFFNLTSQETEEQSKAGKSLLGSGRHRPGNK